MSKTDPDGRSPQPQWVLTRREFLWASACLGLAAATIGSVGPEPATLLRFGIVTDAHYADADTLGSRYYRESLAKMNECVELMNTQQVDFLVELGDLKDQDRKPNEANTLRYTQEIEAVFQQCNAPTYHVLGNHDVNSISKTQFSEIVTNTGIPKYLTYYSFDMQGIHFIVLDANFRSDGKAYDRGNFAWNDTNLPREELEWLRQDLAATTNPTIVFVHQLLDGKGNQYVNNASQVRDILETGNVLAVFQGHRHAGQYKRINGIHYKTLRAMVEGSGEENSAYAIVEVRDDHSLKISGYRKAEGRRMV